MKVLIVFAAAFAVASAGFSGSLVRQTQPHLQQAIHQIKADLAAKIPARNSAEAGFQTQFVDALSNQVNGVIDTIENVVQVANGMAQSVVSSFHAAVSHFQALGTNVVEGAQQILGDLVSNILGSLFGGSKSRALSPAMSAIVAQVASNPAFVSMVHNSESYKCLKAGGITVTLPYLQGLSTSGQLNAGLLENPVIAGCVEQAGGLHALIAGSEVVDWAQNLAASLGMTSMIHEVILQTVGEELGYMIIEALQSGRGFFGDAWNTISGVATNAWDNLSQGVVSAGQYIAGVATSAFQSAAEKFEIIKQLAVAFIQGGITTAQLATQQAAQEFINWMAPYQHDLGNLWDQTVNQVTSIWDGITLPSWQSRVRAF